MSMKKILNNRVISAALAGVMCLQMMPSTVLAIEAITVQEVLPLEQTEYTVDFGTAEKDLPLPEQLEIVALTDAELGLTENTTAEVEWFGEYDAYVPGIYTFEAAFESRAYHYDSDMPKVEVVVLEEHVEILDESTEISVNELEDLPDNIVGAATEYVGEIRNDTTNKTVLAAEHRVIKEAKGFVYDVEPDADLVDLEHKGVKEPVAPDEDDKNPEGPDKVFGVAQESNMGKGSTGDTPEGEKTNGRPSAPDEEGKSPGAANERDAGIASNELGETIKDAETPKANHAADKDDDGVIGPSGSNKEIQSELEVPESDVPLAAGPELDNVDDIAADKWSFSARYVRQSDPYDVTQTDNFTLKYQVNFHTDLDDLKAETVRIEIPAVLYMNREGKKVLPNSFGVPEGTPEDPTPARNSPFNYYVTGDMLILWNYKEIRKGTTTAVQVLYQTQQLMQIVDMTEWTLTPKITITDYTITNEDTEEVIGGSVAAESRPLTGLVDSEINLRVASLESYSSGGTNYTPGLYTVSQIKKYINSELPVKYAGDAFREYFYVIWQGTITGSATQPWTLNVLHIPTAQGMNGDVEGELVGYSISPGRNSAGEATVDGSTVLHDTSYATTVSNTFYVVTAYPNATLREGLNMADEIEVYLTPVDRIDPIQTKSAKATWAYQAYNWEYEGDVIGVDKAAIGSPDLSGWSTAYRIAQKQKTDYPFGMFYAAGKLNGYGTTHVTDTKNVNFGDYIEGSYFQLMAGDDLVYVWDSNNNGARYILDDKDYYFTNVSVTSQDKGYDPYEDEKVPATKDSVVDRSLDVWAMYAGSTTWERVATIPWSQSGIMSYQFTPEQIAKQPYRVKAYHRGIDFSTQISVNCTLVIRHNSPILNDLINNGSGYVTIENLAAVMGKNHLGASYHDGEDTVDVVSYDDYETKYNVSARAISQTLYKDDEGAGEPWKYPMRRSAVIVGTPLQETAQATKTNTIKNDTANGRALIDYTLSAYESYLITEVSDYNYIRSNGSLIGVTMPERRTVQFYDLLPAGVSYNPDVTPVAGRMKSTSLGSFRDLDTAQTEVEVTDYITDYHGTGRNMLVFTVTYTGADPSVFENSHWMQGFGVHFQAYVSWEELPASDREYNIMAYIPEGNKALLGKPTQVGKDDGVIVSEVYNPSLFLGSDGKSLFGPDMNGDKDTKTQNVMYAASAAHGDFATAYSVGLQKLVKADEDVYNNPSESAIVSHEKGYTYTLGVNADEGTTVSDITIFDQIENLPTRNDWQGIFNGVSYDNALRMGASSVTVWYNANRNAVMPHNAGETTTANLDLNSILTEENGWYRESAWTQPLRDVKAVALQLNGLILKSEEAATVQIHMLAPSADDVASDKVVKSAYNEVHMLGTVSAENSLSETKFHDGPKTVVSLDGASTVEVVKEFKDIKGVPLSLQNNPFEIQLTLTKGETSKAFSYAPYNVYEKQSDGSWDLVKENQITSIRGIVELKAGQKAVFAVAGGSYLSAREEESVYWNVEYSNVTNEETGISTLTVTNAYRPILYITKNVGAVPTGTDISSEEFTFRVMLYDKEAKAMVPAADRTYWKVAKAYTNGIVPTKIGEGATDSLGQVRLKKGDIIAIFSDYSGQQFSIEETGMSDNWICLDNTDEGTLGTFGTNTTVTNYWRWKDLYITKNITNQSKEDALAEGETFTFELLDKDGAPVVGNRWVLLDDAGKETTTEGILDAQGRFAAICGFKKVKVEHLAGNEEYTIREVNIPTNYEPTTGSATFTMPVYSTSKSTSLTNEWLRRDMYVTKQFAGAVPEMIVDTTTCNTPIKITFSDQSYTEASSCDYIEIWYKNTNGQIFRTGPYGNDLGGYSLVIPTNDFYVYWKTDGSVSEYYGFDISSASVSSENPTEIGFEDALPSIDVIEATSLEEITSAFDEEHPHGNYGDNVEKLWHYIVPAPPFDESSVDSTAPIDVTFQFTLMDNDRNALVGMAYTTDSGRPGVTDAVGHFELYCGETAHFKDLGLRGEIYYVEETPDPSYPQIYPINNGGTTVLLTDNELNNKATFVNGKDTMLMIKKEWVAKAGDANDTTIVERINDSATESMTLLPTNGNPYDWDKAVPIGMTVNGMEWPSEDTEITAIDPSGEVQTVIWKAEEKYWLKPGWTLFVTSLSTNDKYVVKEDPEYQDWWAKVVIHPMYNIFSLMHVQATVGMVEGNTATMPIVTLVNEVSTFSEENSQSVVVKLMTEDSTPVPEGAVLTYRAERYDESSGRWISADGLDYTLFHMGTATTPEANPMSLPAYAMLYDDGSMVFQRGNAPEAGKTLVASYTGFETDTYDTRYLPPPWEENDAVIKTVIFNDKCFPISTAYWFFGCYNLVSADVRNMDVSNVTDMHNMFQGCSSLTSLDVSKWDTSNVTDMNYMFYNCSSLTTLDVSGWDTSRVTNMSGMFCACSNLYTLNGIEGWDVNNVALTSYMFDGCPAPQPSWYKNWEDSSNQVLPTSAKTKVYPESQSRKVAYRNVVNKAFSMLVKNNGVFDHNGNKFGFNITQGNSDTNGLIRIIAVAGATPVLAFKDIVTKDGSNGTIRLVEVSELTDDAWGKLVRYEAIDSENGDARWAFVNSNVPAKLNVSKELPNNTVESNDRFTFTLERVVENESTETVFPGTFEDYTVYDNDTNIVAGSGNTGAAGTICLKAGQYAQIDTARYTRWKITEEETQNYTLKDIISNAAAPTISIPDQSAVVTMANGETLVKYEITYTGETLAPGKKLTPEDYTVDKITVNEQGYTLLKTQVPLRDYTISVTEVPGLNFVQFISIIGTDEIITLVQECPQTYAMLYEDGSMVFQTGNKPEARKRLIASYKGIENSSYTSQSEVPWYDNCSLIKTVSFKDQCSPISTAYWFADCYNLTQADVTNLDTSNVTSMNSMFNGCSDLITIDGIGGWNTANVIDMQNLFYYCYSLTDINVAGWDTGKVTNMDAMFGCTNVDTLDVSDWNTSKVESMSGMFFSCVSLSTLDVSKWDTSKVTDMSQIFRYCSSLSAVDVSNWDTGNVTDMSYMFTQCYAITMLDFRGWDTSKVTNTSLMFNNCRNLSEVHIGPQTTIGKQLPSQSDTYIKGADGKWYTEDGTGYAPINVPDNVEAVYYAVNPAPSAYAILYDDGSFVFQRENVPEAGKTVVACYTGFENASYTSYSQVPWYNQSEEIKTVYFKDKCSPISTAYWFYGCSKLISVDTANLDTSKVTNMSSMFRTCYSLTSLDVSGWDTSSVISMYHLFHDCRELTSLDVSGWDTSSVTNMSSMFLYCFRLTSLDVSEWNTSNVTNMRDMFFDCKSLTTLDVSGWDTSNVTDMEGMFVGYSSPTSPDVSGWDTSNVTDMGAMFYSCPNLTSLDISGWDTGNVTDMTQMFASCYSLTSLDVSGWNTSRVTNMNYMFNNCSDLISIDGIGEWNTANVTTMSYMFNNCPAPRPSWYKE